MRIAVLRELTHAFRGLRSRSGYATTVVLTLAFGLGSTTVDAVRERPGVNLRCD